MSINGFAKQVPPLSTNYKVATPGMAVSPLFVGVTKEGEILQWCYIYPIIGSTIW